MQRRIASIGIVIIFSWLFGKEGLWLPTQIASLPLEEEGFQITALDIYNPEGVSLKDAIVNLGGGTAEFVSPDGLLLTNHHVAYGAVQRASTRGKDYLTNGFLAATREEELPAPGTTARILLRAEDVTDRVLDQLERNLSPLDRERQIKAHIQALREEVESEGEDLEARIAGMYSGREYWLFVYRRFDDVRVVYMPPLAIGNYGAEIDNWMWPRHSGDFAFLRVYATPEGRGREYDPANVPYHPQTYLKMSTHDLDPGDVTFILGYPGHTNRYRTSYAVRYNLERAYPRTLREFRLVMDLLDSVSMGNHIAELKVAGRKKGLANYLKKTQGMQEAMERAGFLAEKQQFEQDLTAFLQSRRKWRKRYGDVLPALEEHYRALAARDPRDHVLDLFGWLGGTLAANANGIVYTVMEREKPVAERDPDFNEKDVQRRVERLRYSYYSYYEPAEEALLTWVLTESQRLPTGMRIAPLDDLIREQGTPAQAAAYLVENTTLDSLPLVQAWYQASSEDLRQSEDPLLQLALHLYPLLEEHRRWAETWNAEMKDLRQQYISAVEQFRRRPIYPDANGTLRFTYGRVAGYSPRDAVRYEPQTTLKGVIEKDTGVEPFNLPPALRDLETRKDFGDWIDPELEDVPVAFTHQCDITNGNSGSPVLNAWGELVGIAFDLNYEALLADWRYDENLERTISVDIRYVLFVTQKFAGAERILTELGY
ncbi:MAG: S46 family peptidase [Candidatus Neomarinimicrobiota bacterium]|nr:MAG: S46 family peptidase [Candidatus Neomarinimicrobiota bacterium]